MKKLPSPFQRNFQEGFVLENLAKFNTFIALTLWASIKAAHY